MRSSRSTTGQVTENSVVDDATDGCSLCCIFATFLAVSSASLGRPYFYRQCSKEQVSYHRPRRPKFDCCVQFEPGGPGHVAHAHARRASSPRAASGLRWRSSCSQRGAVPLGRLLKTALWTMQLMVAACVTYLLPSWPFHPPASAVHTSTANVLKSE